MADVKLTKDSKAVDFHCPCCGQGELDATFMSQLLLFLEYSGELQLTSTSGFRCVVHNAAVGGKPDSRHLTGNALDLAAPKVSFKVLLIGAANRVGFKGLGLGSNFIHVDNRPDYAMWTYPKKS